MALPAPLPGTAKWSDHSVAMAHIDVKPSDAPGETTFNVGVYGYAPSAFSLLVFSETAEQHADNTIWCDCIRRERKSRGPLLCRSSRQDCWCQVPRLRGYAEHLRDRAG